MKELKIDAEPSYEYTMLSSPKRNLSNLPMNAIVATIFFGCGMILGWVSSGIDQTPVDFTGARAHFRYGLDRSDTLGNNDAMPKLAWLLSFPNSGTSYTGELVRAVTGFNTATNYGESNLLNDGTSELVYTSAFGAAGPFWTDPKINRHKPTNGYILTKTHCGSRCDVCGVDGYVENEHLFLQHCLETSYISKSSTGDLVKSVGTYDKELVARAVHLIRDPFDNIVSRFHLRHNRFTKLNDTESLERYPKTSDGFRAFCNDLSELHAQEEETSKFYHDVIDSIRNVPCHADFFRYIQWHNLAFVTTWDLQIPTLVVHYENFTTNFDETKGMLIEFLGQEAIYEPPTFVAGKTYRDYFSDEEIDGIAQMFEMLAMEKTWHYTRHYFE